MYKGIQMKWIWLLIPTVLMILFEKSIVLSVQIISKLFGAVNPRIFFYIPFLSILPPLILLFIWYWFSFRKYNKGFIITVPGKAISDVVLGFCIAFLCIGVFVGSLKLLQLLALPSIDMSSLTWIHHLYFASLGAIVPGIIEEIYFRGFLFDEFKNIHPTFLICMTSISFAFWHILSPPYLLHTFIIGIILGTAYFKTKRLLPIMVAHSVTNISAGLLFSLGLI
jgi:membrane protease YdiL (CAAX protease family)